MPYNKQFYFEKIVEIQRITLKYKEQGISQRYIYEHYIYPVFRISRSAFYSYLSIPAARELKRLKEKEKPALPGKQNRND